MKQPVLFLVFNRLDTAKQVLEVIAQYKPERFYIAADGARTSKEGEKEKCEAVRDYVLSRIDWDCEVKTLFREENLGCRYAVWGAITWFFEQEEEGIILEDDCLPHIDFFRFCEEMLEKYREEERVSIVSGHVAYKEGIAPNTNYSYDYSAMSYIWGWATWRRNIQSIDFEITFSLDELTKKLRKVLPNKKLVGFYEKVYNKVKAGEISSWAYSHTLSNIFNNKLSILPKRSLIRNIGFIENSTHTNDTESVLSKLPHYALEHPLIAPKKLTHNKLMDDRINFFRYMQADDTFQGIIERGIKRIKRYL